MFLMITLGKEEIHLFVFCMLFILTEMKLHWMETRSLVFHQRLNDQAIESPLVLSGLPFKIGYWYLIGSLRPPCIRDSPSLVLVWCMTAVTSKVISVVILWVPMSTELGESMLRPRMLFTYSILSISKILTLKSRTHISSVMRVSSATSTTSSRTPELIILLMEASWG